MCDAAVAVVPYRTFLHRTRDMGKNHLELEQGILLGIL